ncbi:tRNA uridine-5-carboxymethylaminomethyl(34) synthesis GTPase MnmE, partial [Streptococcus pneumoniae]|nr:tRNA uridine-5-carboxymethylaminomethyl(34) synthesis GTPase MnmE [Streptococcus pneumoniae]
MMEFDTIAAISTPSGEGAIAIVRLSGPEAVAIADRLFRAPSAKALAEQASHTIHYGHIEDPATKETAEEVMVALMRAP